MSEDEYTISEIDVFFVNGVCINPRIGRIITILGLSMAVIAC